MVPVLFVNSCYEKKKKKIDNGLNANQYCKWGLTNSKYYDVNILVVWILVLGQTNVVVFSAAMSHLRGINFWSASIPNLFHVNYFKPVSLALYFCFLNSNLAYCMYSYYCFCFRPFLPFKINLIIVSLTGDLNPI